MVQPDFGKRDYVFSIRWMSISQFKEPEDGACSWLRASHPKAPSSSPERTRTCIIKECHTGWRCQEQLTVAPGEAQNSKSSAISGENLLQLTFADYSLQQLSKSVCWACSSRVTAKTLCFRKCSRVAAITYTNLEQGKKVLPCKAQYDPSESTTHMSI